MEEIGKGGEVAGGGGGGGSGGGGGAECRVLVMRLEKR